MIMSEGKKYVILLSETPRLYNVVLWVCLKLNTAGQWGLTKT